MANGKCNVISMDMWGVMNALRDYYVTVLEYASAQLIDIMKTEIGVTIYGDGPGTPEWRENLQNAISIINREVADREISFEVGAPDTNNVAEYVSRMIVTYGAGMGAGNPFIRSKPGEVVFDKNLNLITSHATTAYLLPIAFNQRGNHWLENAMKIVERHFKDIIDTANANLPDEIFWS